MCCISGDLQQRIAVGAGLHRASCGECFPGEFYRDGNGAVFASFKNLLRSVFECLRYAGHRTKKGALCHHWYQLR